MIVRKAISTLLAFASVFLFCSFAFCCRRYSSTILDVYNVWELVARENEVCS